MSTVSRTMRLDDHHILMTTIASSQPAPPGSAGTDFVQPADRSVILSELRRVAGKRGVLAIRALPRWDDAVTVRLDGTEVAVAACETALAVRDALSRRHDPDRRLVILTDLTTDQLGDGICDHLVGGRPLQPDPWQSLRERFGAARQESALLSTRESARAASRLVGDRTPPPAPGGVLTRDHLIRTLTVSQFGLGENGASAVDVLVWSADPANTRRFHTWVADSHPHLAADVFGWFAGTLGPAAAAIVDCWRPRGPADLLPLGLVGQVLVETLPAGGTLGGDRDADRESMIELRGRFEQFIGTGARLSDTAVDGWGRTATLAADRLASARDAERALFAGTQRRADALATELRVGRLAERSDYLPAALDQRLDRVAGAAADAERAWPVHGVLVASAIDDLESAWNRVQEHSTVNLTPDSEWPRDVGLAQAVLRLLRFVALPVPEPTDLAATIAGHRESGSWVDAAVNDAFVGSDRPALAEVAHRVVHRIRRQRTEQDLAAARLIAAGGTYRSAVSVSAPPLLMIEDVLDHVLLPLSTATASESFPGVASAAPTRSPVLLIVADGMSAAAANDVLLDIDRRHAATWLQADLDVHGQARAALVAFPSVTRFSRCSLLSGRISAGDQRVESRNFGDWLSAHSLGSRDQTLFHKADIEAVSSGHALPQAVRQAIDDTIHRPVVACVLNAIDDALDRSDPIGTRWTTAALHPLDALLHAAARVGRIVVLTSDHGHVVERREQPSRQRGQGLSARWRPAPGASSAQVTVEGDEILLEGNRVATDGGRAILAVSEQIRYSRGLKAGYHGGAALAEVVVPIAILVPGEIPTELPLTASGPRVPPWWVGTDPRPTTEQAPEEWPAPRTRRPAVIETPAEPGLFAAEAVTGPEPSNPPARPGRPTRPGRADPVQRLLETDAFRGNHQRFAGQLAADQIGALLRTLIVAGGSVNRPRAAASLGVAERRLSGVLAVIGQVLNIDGVVVIGQSGSEVRLSEASLYEQFGIRP